MRRLGLLALAIVTFAIAVALALGVAAIFDRPGAVLYVGGPILTLDPEDSIVEALATEGERITAVGDAATLRAWAAERDATIVELDGRAVIPGFIDAHGHFPGEGLTAVHLDLNSPPIGDVEGLEDLVARLAERAAQTAEDQWVIGSGYDDMLLAEARHPTRHDLDRASVEHPIAVLHISGHLAVVNTTGLSRLAIDSETEDPEGGVIRREAGTRQPDGVLEETAMDDVQLLVTPSPSEAVRILLTANARYLSQGVTTAQSGYTPQSLLEFYKWCSRLFLIPLRLVLWPDVEAANAMLDGRYSFEGPDPLWMRAGAIKIIADGSLQGYTGYLREPYYVPPGDDASYRGYPRIAAADLAATVGRLHAAGMQLAIHGNGDASIDDILDAYEAAQRAHPRPDARHIVIHAQTARDDQLDRMKALGVIPSFFSLHTFYWGDRHRDIFLGPERAARISPARSAIDRDLRFTIHCDSPVVPMEPLRLVWAAVNRRTRSGRVLGPDQRISPLEALRAVTIDAAYQHFEERDKGSLEPGKLADLVVLSASPLDSPETIDQIQVLETVIGGRSVHWTPWR